MTTKTTSQTSSPLVIHLGPLGKNMSEDEFFEFCQLNRDLRIERTRNGELIVMAPAGGKAGNLGARIIARLNLWAESDATGLAFDSSTGFILPSGVERSPDFAWVSGDRWAKLSEKEREQFPPLCPDFLGEIRSPTDSLRSLKAKMSEYLENGARLAWLIDPQSRKVYVYRPDRAPEVLDRPQMVSADPILPGFVLEIGKLWG